jgi:hypothetical protein
VFFDATGARLPAPGFDAIIGNPPWDMMRADTGPGPARSQARADVGNTLRFTRHSGVYACQSSGHANRYQVFVERVVALARSNGRIGLVLPAGLTMDQGSGRLRRLLFSECDLDAIVGFENRKRIFPIHRSVRFLLVTATRGRPTAVVGCRLGEVDPAVLETANAEEKGDAWLTVRLTPAALRRLSGDDLTVPDLRTPMDLVIAERAAALFPPIGDPAGWAIRFGRELNATEDADRFRPAGHGLPVIEGKAITPFHADVDHPRLSISRQDAGRLLGVRHERARLAYRDVASSTNRLTLIAAVLPAGCVSTHTVFCLRTPASSKAQHFLCGMFNSLVVNYLVRLRVATHVTTTIVERLPIPRSEHAPRTFEEIAALSRLLARRPPTRRVAAGRTEVCPADSTALARLNARVARLYQLGADEFEHVLDTFPLIAREERNQTLREFLR